VPGLTNVQSLSQSPREADQQQDQGHQGANKIDLVGPARRGLAMGLNEAAGYGAVALTALATGWLAAAYGLRPAPFLLHFRPAASKSSTLTQSETPASSGLKSAIALSRRVTLLMVSPNSSIWKLVYISQEPLVSVKS
jgi:hypothetical protein